MSAEICSNRKALHDYTIESRIEAGLELLGTEVKSIRAGHVNLRGSYARIDKHQAYVFDMDIQPYAQASHEQHEPKRKRRLLLHRREIEQLFVDSGLSGRTLVPLRLYWKSGRIKIEIGVGKGKLIGDKRSDLKKREESREADRTAANFNRHR